MPNTLTDSAAKPKKRFIASAICPQCKAFDSIVWYEQPEEYIQCIHCSFIQKKTEVSDKESKN